MEELNKKVMRSAKGEKFITFFIAQYNATTRELTYVNAGHNQPFITNGKTENYSTKAVWDLVCSTSCRLLKWVKKFCRPIPPWCSIRME